MNKNILFKINENDIYIIVNDKLNFEEFIYSFKEKLNNLFIRKDLLQMNAILDIHNIALDNKKILQIFDLLENYETIYLSEIIYKEKINKSILLYEGNIHAGENKIFTSNTLIIGNINKGSNVILNGNLYVIGKIKGNIELKGKNYKVYCSSIEDSFIKICNKQLQQKENIDNALITYKNEEIVIERRENYGKSNCSYIR